MELRTRATTREVDRDREEVEAAEEESLSRVPARAWPATASIS